MTTASALQAAQYQRRPIKIVNSVLRSAQLMGMARFTLDENQLLDEARRKTGLSDFGDERFLEPLRILLHSTNTEASLTPVGRFLAKANIQRLLNHRLWAQDLFKRHPEILARELPDPVVIVGPARSGTTRLHRLLAADERFLHLESWESVYPVPHPECFEARDKGEQDPRIAALDQGLKAVLYMSPQIAAVHPLGTHEVEEEIGLLQHGFSTQLFEVINILPSFNEWLMTHNQNAAYELMVDYLKLISWWRKDPEDKPWLLKSPQHLQDLDALLHVFPGARLLCPHRDPVKVTGSCCSMAWNSLVRDNPEVTPEWVGQEWLTKLERMLHKNLSERDTLISPDRQYDVLYADITANWQQSMAGIYNFLGMPFTEQARMGMLQWLDSNAQHKHGAHKYTLAQFGLTAESVEEKLAFYRERFAIPRETHNPHRQN